MLMNTGVSGGKAFIASGGDLGNSPVTMYRYLLDICLDLLSRCAAISSLNPASKINVAGWFAAWVWHSHVGGDFLQICLGIQNLDVPHGPHGPPSGELSLVYGDFILWGWVWNTRHGANRKIKVIR